MKKSRLLFIQLPQLDNDPTGGSENERLAAAYLLHSLERAGERSRVEPIVAPPETDRLDNAHFLDYALACRPDVIAATLYAWNVERSIRVLRELRRRQPGLRVIVGGPEVAPRHPFLFRARVADVAVCGEGEPVFPSILRAFRSGKPARLARVAQLTPGGYRWGSDQPPIESLAQTLPPHDHPLNRPDAAGIAYMETTRGCPLHCAFCCYNQRRRVPDSLPVPDAIRRIETLRQRGASEIRFIDPTFNAHPQFDALIAAIARLNRDRTLAFFAELRADTLTDEQATILARARFMQIEVGIQSSDPTVLRSIRRPLAGRRVDQGIRALARNKVGLTLDVMCGLPGQTLADIRRTLRRAARFPKTHVQLLHTLLLPGTELRDRRRALGLVAPDRPPYRVERTPSLTADGMRQADEYAARLLRRQLDCPARRFAGRHLPDLFPEAVPIDIERPPHRIPGRIPGQSNRRALLIRGRDLFAAQNRILRVIRTAIRNEPDALWQFVLCPLREEPLDLLDGMTEAIDRFPPHFTDRLRLRRPGAHRVSRRIFVRLPARRRLSPAWIDAVESLLSERFY